MISRFLFRDQGQSNLAFFGQVMILLLGTKVLLIDKLILLRNHIIVPKFQFILLSNRRNCLRCRFLLDAHVLNRLRIYMIHLYLFHDAHYQYFQGLSILHPHLLPRCERCHHTILQKSKYQNIYKDVLLLRQEFYL